LPERHTFSGCCYYVAIQNVVLYAGAKGANDGVVRSFVRSPSGRVRDAVVAGPGRARPAGERKGSAARGTNDER